MKYIDADCLRKVVEEKYNSNDQVGDGWDLGYDTACEQILDIIDSLQQEGPLEKTFEDYLKATPAERRKMDMTKILGAEKLAKVKEMMEQEQPDFPTTDEQVKEFLAVHPKIEVPEKYKNPDWLFEKQEQPSSSDLDEAAEKVEDYYDVGDEHGYLYCHRGDIKDAFIAGAKWQYQKDRGEFAKIKAKTWCEGFDAAISQFVKIPYEPRDWFSSGDGDFICGASFDEAIPAEVELYYKKEDKK